MRKSALSFMFVATQLAGMQASAEIMNTTLKWEARASKKSITVLNAFAASPSLIFRWDPAIKGFVSPPDTLTIQTAGDSAHKINTELIRLQPNGDNAAAPHHTLGALATVTSKNKNTPATPQTMTTLLPNAHTLIHFTLNPNKTPIQEVDLNNINRAYQEKIELLVTASWVASNE